MVINKVIRIKILRHISFIIVSVPIYINPVQVLVQGKFKTSQTERNKLLDVVPEANK